jgi:acetyl-CoA carboxylase biotin carboxyl carrier protein
MDLAYIRRLIKLLSESEVDEIELEEEGKKIRLVKHQNNRVQTAAGPFAPSQAFPAPPRDVPVPVISSPEPSASSAVSAPTVSPAAAFHEVKSPIVGTFYRSPAPEAPPFVQVGTTVSAGTVLCIVEAMKLMNEIECDISGKIVKILVENGQAVEYDQTLFLVETT